MSTNSIEQLAELAAAAAVEKLIPRLRAEGLPVEREWLSPRDAATYVGLSRSRLEELRHKGGGPRFHRLGTGRGASIRYRRRDIDAWVEGGDQ